MPALNMSAPPHSVRIHPRTGQVTPINIGGDNALITPSDDYYDPEQATVEAFEQYDGRFGVQAMHCPRNGSVRVFDISTPSDPVELTRTDGTPGPGYFWVAQQGQSTDLGLVNLGFGFIEVHDSMAGATLELHYQSIGSIDSIENLIRIIGLFFQTSDATDIFNGLIPDGSLTLEKLEDVTGPTTLGRLSGTGPVASLTSEQAAKVVNAAASSLYLAGVNGLGSTSGNVIFRFTAATQFDPAGLFTYADSEANGAAITIDKNCIAWITFDAEDAASGGYMYISKNQSVLTAVAAESEIIGKGQMPNNSYLGNASFNGILSAGDVIRLARSNTGSSSSMGRASLVFLPI